MQAHSPRRVRLVVFDWAGTTVDHGCFAPVAPFMEVFRDAGIDLSIEQARGPMGLGKREHLAALLELPQVRQQWKGQYDREPNDADLDRLFREFVPRQLACVRASSRLVPGLLDVVAQLRHLEIKLAGTTGYFREAAELVLEAAREQGYVPDANACVSDVPAGRPAPWMMFRVMQQLDVYPPAAVVKVGDTVPDVGEGRNAGAWTVGVAASGSDIGLTAEDFAALPGGERQSRLNAVRQKLLAAGAHWVIETISELPRLLVEIEERLDAGERP
jgi:phosphonoacetaldehyde hydrolase